MEVDPLKEKILKHYNSVSREQSPKEVVQLRKISNYAKSTLFSTFAKPVSDHPSILDMSCGRGGDIGKWEKQGFERYVGFDVSSESIQESVRRWQGMQHKIQDSSFLVADFCDPDLPVLLNGEKFDCISCQFAVHYAFYSSKSVFNFFKNVSKMLKPNGKFVSIYANGYSIMNNVLWKNTTRFGNNVYKLSLNCSPGVSTKWLYSSMEWINPGRMTYNFSLAGCVSDCPEFIACINDGPSGYMSDLGFLCLYGNTMGNLCIKFGNKELADRMGVCNEFHHRRLWKKIRNIMEVSDIYKVYVLQLGDKRFNPTEYVLKPKTEPALKKKKLSDFISVRDTPLQCSEVQKESDVLQAEQPESAEPVETDLQIPHQTSPMCQHSTGNQILH